MYKSPIEKYLANVKMTVDDGIYRAVTQYGFKVDKDELLKALRYDREQYETGFIDGYESREEEIIHCKDCKYYREGEYFEGTKFCFRLKHGDKHVGYNFSEDDFCSRGEMTLEYMVHSAMKKLREED